MTQKIGIAVVHGVGSQKAQFARAFAARLRARFADRISGKSDDPPNELQIRGVYWAKALSEKEHALEERFHLSDLQWGAIRDIGIDLGGDALAYQLGKQASPDDPPGTYELIHEIFAVTLNGLVTDTDPEAPLIIVGHSLGTVIASNYLWDLQTNQVAPYVAAKMGDSPLEHGRSLVGVYTMGSPIAISGLRFDDFGTPIRFPSDQLLPAYGQTPKEWVNLYDKDDVIAYPLKCVNDAYDHSVTEDKQVNVGNVLTMWNPASHTAYWTDSNVITRIADGLERVWMAVNP